MSTNITEEHRRAFEALTSGDYDNFALFSCPASCKTFLPEHAFTPQDTGYSGRIGVRIEFTAGEVKPPVQSVVESS